MCLGRLDSQSESAHLMQAVHQYHSMSPYPSVLASDALHPRAAALPIPPAAGARNICAARAARRFCCRTTWFRCTIYRLSQIETHARTYVHVCTGCDVVHTSLSFSQRTVYTTILTHTHTHTLSYSTYDTHSCNGQARILCAA